VFWDAKKRSGTVTIVKLNRPRTLKTHPELAYASEFMPQALVFVFRSIASPMIAFLSLAH
jgi:hypothetical protein